MTTAAASAPLRSASAELRSFWPANSSRASSEAMTNSGPARERPGGVAGAARQGGHDPIGRDAQAQALAPGRQCRPAHERGVGHDAVRDAAPIDLGHGLLGARDRLALEHEDAVEIEQQATDAGHRRHRAPALPAAHRVAAARALIECAGNAIWVALRAEVARGPYYQNPTVPGQARRTNLPRAGLRRRQVRIASGVPLDAGSEPGDRRHAQSKRTLPIGHGTPYPPNG